MRPVFVAAFLAALSSPVHADNLIATLSQPVKEVSHSVDLRIERGVAILKVRRTFANGGSKHDEAHLLIKTPPGAAATGLRIRAAKRWYDGELMRADKARAMYEKLTGMGVYRPKDPALLQWLWSDELELYLFPIPPKRTSTVEYTLTVPTEYRDGRYYIGYPRRGDAENLADPTFRVLAPYATRIAIDGSPAAANEPTTGPPVSPVLKHFDLEEGASHVTRTLKPAWRWERKFGPPATAVVNIDIRHTYRGDLRVMLVPPWKTPIMLVNREGGSKNNLRIEETVKLTKPVASDAAGPWHLIVSDHAGKDVGVLRRWSIRLENGQHRGTKVTDTKPLPLPDAPSTGNAAGMHLLEIEAPTIRTMASRLGRVNLINKKHFLRLELDMAAKLRKLPRRAQVVFVLDLSRSQGKKDIEAQLELVRGYLTHVPDADFALVGYARRARVLSTFKSASKLEDTLLGLENGSALDPRNGSSVDAGLRSATALLRPRHGPKRIVALSDALLRPSWTNRDALSVLRKGAGQPIVHLVLHKRSGNTTAVRDDKNALAKIPRFTGGILQRVAGLSIDKRKDVRDAVLSLVRPMRIDNVEHNGPSDLHVPDTLEEGSALREMFELERSPMSFTIRGEIWSSPYRQVIRAQGWFNRITAALIFPADLYSNLTDQEQYRVAMYGRAVSPMTSYLAIEPGVRPSTAGIRRRRTRAPIVRIGSAGYGMGGGGGYGRIDWAQFYRAGVAECRTVHKDKQALTLVVDTTMLETVDVAVRGKASPLTRCVVEAAWKVELPQFHKNRDQHVLTF